MYTLKPGIKKDPVRRWALPDRIFFGNGTCAILGYPPLVIPSLVELPSAVMVSALGFCVNGAAAKQQTPSSTSATRLKVLRRSARSKATNPTKTSMQHCSADAPRERLQLRSIRLLTHPASLPKPDSLEL